MFLQIKAELVCIPAREVMKVSFYPPFNLLHHLLLLPLGEVAGNHLYPIITIAREVSVIFFLFLLNEFSHFSVQVLVGENVLGSYRVRQAQDGQSS